MRADAEPSEWPARYLWLDAVWAGFALLNLGAMLAVPTWETVPFHFIWVSLTLLYGFRVWRPETTGWVLTAVVTTTGVILYHEVQEGFQPPDELTEVPLMAAMFLAMVWHARRRLVAIDRERDASEANRRLLERQRQFVQDASHELRTPITIALGHAELVARSGGDPEVAEDVRIVVDELARLRRLADRLLLLATVEEPGFLVVSPTELAPLVSVVMERWSLTDRDWRLEHLDDATVPADADRLAMALDALVENAVKRTSPGDEIRLAVRNRGDHVAIVVADSGPGISPEMLGRIFDRFARLDPGRSRDGGGVGLGLPIVKAIAEAHGGGVRVSSAVGRGSTFEIDLPLDPGGAMADPPGPVLPLRG
jgi:signal transduction histidine kinase